MTHQNVDAQEILFPDKHYGADIYDCHWRTAIEGPLETNAAAWNTSPTTTIVVEPPYRMEARLYNHNPWSNMTTNWGVVNIWPKGAENPPYNIEVLDRGKVKIEGGWEEWVKTDLPKASPSDGVTVFAYMVDAGGQGNHYGVCTWKAVDGRGVGFERACVGRQRRGFHQ